MQLPDFCAHVRALCTAHGGSVTSWIRSTRRNRQAGGVATSYHLDGLAVDLVLDDHSKTAALIAAAKARGLRAIDEGDHVHVQATSRK